MTVEGVDEAAVSAWMRERVTVAPPLRFEPVEGGRSNLTFVVTDAGRRRFVLRRPPLHSVLRSAHDVGREHRIIAALQDTAVPVPPVVGHEPSADVIGAPFFVMGYVDGLVVRDREVAATLSAAARRRVGGALVDVLADLHAIDPDACGLGDLGRRQDYVARQLHRWHAQLEAGRTRALPALDDVHGRLAADVPTQQAVAIVHGDYRLDNLIVSPEGDVRAVVDWELCTLGDPLADVGLLQVYWSQPGDPVEALPGAPTLAGGFPDRAALADRYADRTGLDLAELDYYVAFGYWKLAAILEGVYGRYRAGAYGEVDPAAWEPYGRLVERLGELARRSTELAGR